MPENTVGKRIKACREAGGYSQAWLARELGIDRSTISRYEKGTTGKITLSTLEKIAELLGTTREYLCYGRGPVRVADAGEQAEPAMQDTLRSPAASYHSVRRESELTEKVLAQLCRSGRFVMRVETEELIPRIAPGDQLTVVVSDQIKNKYINLFLADGKIMLRRVSCDGSIVTFMPNGASLYPESYALDELQEKMKIIGYVEKLESSQP